MIVLVFSLFILMCLIFFMFALVFMINLFVIFIAHFLSVIILSSGRWQELSEMGKVEVSQAKDLVPLTSHLVLNSQTADDRKELGAEGHA